MTNETRTNDPVYMCPVCGRAYNSIDSMYACFTSCMNAKKEAEKEAARKKEIEKQRLKQAEQDKRMEEIKNKVSEAVELIRAYNKDYRTSAKLGIPYDIFDPFDFLFGKYS